MKISIFVTVAAVGAAAAALYTYDQRRLRADIERAHAQNRELAAALASSRSERTGPTILLPKQDWSESHESPEGSGERRRSNESNDSTPEAQDEAAAPSIDEYLLGVQQAFERDPVDATWARTVRPTVVERLAKLTGEGSSVSAVDCRSTFCRVDLSHRDPAAYSEFQHRLRMPDKEPLWRGSMYFNAEKTRPDGSLGTQVYLVREGVDFDPAS